MTGPLVAVVLAAGAGTRFAASGGAGHKLLAPVGGAPLVTRAVDAALDAEVGEVIVVSGRVDLSEVLAGRRIHLVRNERWTEGLATSLQTALAAADRLGAEAVIVGLGDQPTVPASAWRAVADFLGARQLVVATYGGIRGNPVGIARELWGQLPTGGDEGARVLMRQRPDLVTEVACDGDPHDVDTLEDLDRWS